MKSKIMVSFSFRKKDLHGEDYRSQTYHDVKSGDKEGMSSNLSQVAMFLLNSCVSGASCTKHR